MSLSRSYVVTGGNHGIGRAIAERLAEEAHVVILDLNDSPDWDGRSVQLVTGDAADPATATHAATTAEAEAPLVGWVNNAAVFSDATLSTATATHVIDLIRANLALAATGCHTAVNHFLTHKRPGAIVNVSSHQAQRPVRGALPYAVAKAATEALTKSIAVDHGPEGIRTNAVALGSIATSRYEAYRHEHPEVEADMASLHPLGRVGTAAEVADAVAFLVSERASFINGAILPIDGGRAAKGADPEAT